MEVFVQDWGGVACSRNRSEVGHVMVELLEDV
jgi:hypothetical protein